MGGAAGTEPEGGAPALCEAAVGPASNAAGCGGGEMTDPEGGSPGGGAGTPLAEGADRSGSKVSKEEVSTSGRRSADVELVDGS